MSRRALRRVDRACWHHTAKCDKGAALSSLHLDDWKVHWREQCVRQVTKTTQVWGESRVVTPFARLVRSNLWLLVTVCR